MGPMAAPLIGPGTRTQAGIDNSGQDPARGQRRNFRAPDFEFRAAKITHIVTRRDSGPSKVCRRARPMPVKPTANRPLDGVIARCCTASIALQNELFSVVHEG
jgi:hypothetical protein